MPNDFKIALLIFNGCLAKFSKVIKSELPALKDYPKSWRTYLIKIMASSWFKLVLAAVRAQSQLRTRT